MCLYFQVANVAFSHTISSNVLKNSSNVENWFQVIFVKNWTFLEMIKISSFSVFLYFKIQAFLYINVQMDSLLYAGNIQNIFKILLGLTSWKILKGN
jgi:hypothetical protein